MIIYKMNEINSAINELDNELDKSLDNAENILKNSLNELKEEENKINLSEKYSVDGKKDLIKDLREKKCEEAKKLGATNITEIEKIYIKYIDEVKKLVKYDNEQKEVRESKLSDSTLNTQMLYATCTLSEIEDEIGIDILLDLKEMYKENENILKLVYLKTKKLLRNEKYKDNEVLNQLKNQFHAISKNYIKDLEDRKNNYLDRYKTNNYTYKVFPHNLESLFKVNDDVIDKFFK